MKYAITKERLLKYFNLSEQEAKKIYKDYVETFKKLQEIKK